MSQNSKYTYCDLDPDKIRLLKLKAPDLRIECELHVFKRANAPSFTPYPTARDLMHPRMLSCVMGETFW